LSEDGRWVLVQDFVLPAGYNVATTQVLMSIPPDYPVRAPGPLPHGIYLPTGLKSQGRTPRHIMEGQGPGWGKWSWLCMYRIDWDSRRGDDLVRLLELVRAILSLPAAP
jgi:hypothetical protein